MAETGGRRNVPGSWASALTIILGLGLCVLSPILTRATGMSGHYWGFWNNILTGVLIAILGFMGMRSTSSAPNAAQVALGLWLLIAPMIEGYGHGNIGFDSLFVGGLVAFFGLIAMVMKSSTGWRRSASM